MIVHHRFRRRDLDNFGLLTADSLRSVARTLWDCPLDIQVLIDLGPVRQVQQQLIRDISLYRCAPSVRFTGRDWRAVRTHTNALAKTLDAATEAV